LIAEKTVLGRGEVVGGGRVVRGLKVDKGKKVFRKEARDLGGV
jgi:hypothetical protein